MHIHDKNCNVQFCFKLNCRELVLFWNARIFQKQLLLHFASLSFNSSNSSILCKSKQRYELCKVNHWLRPTNSLQIAMRLIVAGFIFKKLKKMLSLKLKMKPTLSNTICCELTRGGTKGMIGAIAPPKTYESNFFHHDFVQFGRTLDCQVSLDCQILLKLPPLNLRAGSAPGANLHATKLLWLFPILFYWHSNF